MTSTSSLPERPSRARDWAAIREAYASRETSIRDICRIHGIHSQELYRTVQKEGWPLRRESRGGRRQTLQMLTRLRRIAESQIDEIETRSARTELATPAEPERDARALTALVKLIEHIAALEAKIHVRRDATREDAGGPSPADRARRRSELADKLIAMLEQERGAPLPDGDRG